MAIIIKCKKCNKRVSPVGELCPLCSSAEFSFIVDYWPTGRNGQRIRQPLPESIKTPSKAHEIEALMHQARKTKSEPCTPKGNTVAQLFPQYLDWYELYRAKTTYTDLFSIWNSHFSKHLGPRKVENIDSGFIHQHQKNRKAKNVSTRTINKELD